MNNHSKLVLLTELYKQANEVLPWRELEQLMTELNRRKVSDEEWDTSLTHAFAVRMGALDTKILELRRAFNSSIQIAEFSNLIRILAQAFVSSFYVFLAKVAVVRTGNAALARVYIQAAIDTLKNSPSFRNYQRQLTSEYFAIATSLQDVGVSA